MFYSLVKPLLFRIDPERIHHRVMSGLVFAGERSWLRSFVAAACRIDDPRLVIERFGLRFPNPIGLAAGFDKNAVAVPMWPALGFGSVEIGSVTALAQSGNPQPRLFRLPHDHALINRMGFNNDGAERIAARLQSHRSRHGPLPVPLGVNLGKSKVTPLEEAPEDYRRSMASLWPFADYFVINVSSPNTPGLRQLQDRDRLMELLRVVCAYAVERAGTEGPRRPILVKISPDLTEGQLDEIVDLAIEQNVAGLIATNTTLSRDGLHTVIDEAGGLSGRPLAQRSLEVLRRLRARAGERLPLISAGGIFTAQDVYQRIRAGACLVQVYTGFVYNGPFWPRALQRGLLEALERDRLERLEQAIGIDAGR